MKKTASNFLTQMLFADSQDEFFARDNKDQMTLHNQQQWISKHKDNTIYILEYIEYLIQKLQPFALDALQENKDQSVDVEAQIYQKREEQRKWNKRISIKTTDNIHVIHLSDIIYCESDKGYTTFYLVNKEKVMTSKILRDYEEVLPTSDFMRIHQSFLVNLNHILRYEKKDKNCIVTTHHYEIPVSHRLKNKLITYLNDLK